MSFQFNGYREPDRLLHVASLQLRPSSKVMATFDFYPGVGLRGEESKFDRVDVFKLEPMFARKSPKPPPPSLQMTTQGANPSNGSRSGVARRQTQRSTADDAN